MKTIAKFVATSMMLSFLVFVWLSHSGILSGSIYAHFWGGLGTLIVAFGGFVMIWEMHKGTAPGCRDFAHEFFFFYGILFIVNAIVFSFLRAGNIIGPNDDIGASWLGVLYYILGFLGIIAILDALDSRVVR